MSAFKEKLDNVCTEHNIDPYLPMSSSITDAPVTNISQKDTVGTIQIQNLSLMHSQYQRSDEVHRTSFE